jgi:RNA polymerase sigma-70 factor (ECF subfamily)
MIALVTEAARSGPVPGRSAELDRATLVRAQRGDPIAFRAFVVRYERPVFALLSRLLGPGRDVEDLAQETFLRAFRALPRFDLDGRARPSTWLLTIATRLALDEKKKRKLPVEPLHHDSAPDDRSPERSAARTELARAIARAADELPDDQRAAFVLSEFHGLSHAEIGEVLSAPEATIKTRLFRAREKLKQALRPFVEER